VTPEISESNPVLWVERPASIDVTAHDVGCQLATDSAEKQSAILRHFANEVNAYGPNESWVMQCRYIAESLSDHDCHSVASTLRPLLEHLEAIPLERAQAMEAAK
jgi:hypothetical protein